MSAVAGDDLLRTTFVGSIDDPILFRLIYNHWRIANNDVCGCGGV